MKKTFLIPCFAFILFACNKDNFQSKPQITVASGENVLVPNNNDARLGITLNYTDQEGDLDSVFIRKVRVNRRITATLTARDTLKFKLPDYPPNPKGEIFLTLEYTNHLIAAVVPPPVAGGTEPDSLQLRIIVKDKAGNKSDTAYVNNVIVQR